MIVDTSAMIAILKKEPGYERLATKLLNAKEPKIPLPAVVEMQLVTRDEQKIDEMLQRFGLKVLPVEVQQLSWLRFAIQNFARGSGSPAKLNFGDCFSYAASRALNEPLLFKGTDFSATDVIAA